jgi:hypothetical protein
MSDWAYNHHTEIDTIFFEQKTIEDIINLRFTLSNGVLTYQLVEHNILILVCHPCGVAEAEQI